MEIILLKDMASLGMADDVVKVKNGYARNFLIPQGIAVVANKSNLGSLEQRKKSKVSQENKKLAVYQGMAEKLNGQTIKVGAKAGTTGKIFGSVTSVQVGEAVQEFLGSPVDHRKITLETDVKELGSYNAKIALHPEVVFNLEFEVIED